MRLITARGGREISFPIEEGETFIGRKEYCEICFPNPSLSKRHARLVREGGRVWAYDAGSRNGTLVNGELIEEAELFDGDVLVCGNVEFRIEGVGGGGSVSTGRRGYGFVDEPPPLSTRSGAAPKLGSLFPTARAVASADARPSMMDVLPELPPSVEVAGADAASRTDAQLRLVEGGAEQVWRLSEDTVTIGSKDENAIVIKGEGVSRYHAELAREETGWVLKDLGARNGIFVAGARIDVYELTDGDEVQIGTCKLRFELASPDPLQAVHAVLERLKDDPVEAFKTDSRVRLSLAVLVTALLLAVMAVTGGPSGGGGGTRSGQLAFGPWLDEGATLLERGSYRQARGVFRQAKAHVSAKQDVPQVLESIAALWMNLERGPLAFRWEKASELIQLAARLEGLPDDLNRWLKKQAEFVDANGAAYRILTDAENLGAEAAGYAERGTFRGALDAYRRAVARANEVPTDTLFATRAKEIATTLRQSAFRTLVGEAGDRMRTPSPRWDECLGLLTQAVEFAATPNDRSELRTLSDACDRNRRDEAWYMRGVRIVKDRAVDRYSEAIQYFDRVSQQSRIYPDARAYREWVDADQKVRQAQRAYDLGDERSAFDLLSKALEHQVLGPEARASVRTRFQKWTLVVSAYKKGMELHRLGQTNQARAELKRVLELEPKRANRFHVRARKQLTFLAKIETSSLTSKLKDGFDYLERREWANAKSCFDQVRQDPNHNGRDLDRIRRAVARANESRRLFDTAKRDLLHDRTERFNDLLAIFDLLKHWLPKDHPDRAEAAKHLETVVERLKAIQRTQR